jgi:hypothetical protein
MLRGAAMRPVEGCDGSTGYVGVMNLPQAY